MRGGDWYKCAEHDMVFPRGAHCPACGPPPKPITLEDINERLIRVEALLNEKTKIADDLDLEVTAPSLQHTTEG